MYNLKNKNCTKNNMLNYMSKNTSLLVNLKKRISLRINGSRQFRYCKIN